MLQIRMSSAAVVIDALRVKQTAIADHTAAELQIRRGNEANSKRIFLFLNGNTCCDPSSEPSQRDGSNEGSQHMFLDYPQYPPYLELWVCFPGKFTHF